MGIVDAVNKLQTSPWFGHQADFSQLLGGIRRNSSGHIVSAEAVRMFWSIKVPEDAEIVESQGSGVELELGDATSLAWEEVYTGSFNHSDLVRLDSLVTNLHTLKEQQLYIQDYNCWWTHFNTFMQHKTNFSSWKDIDNPDDFPIVLSDFLFSVHGSRFKINFQFSEELLCNKPAPNILATKFDIKYFPFDGPEEHVPAKDHIDYLISQSGLQDAFSFVKIYAAWETDRIIGFELWRNMGLAILCVFIITLILLANLKICLMVLGIVILTLTDIVGFLHFWSITI